MEIPQADDETKLVGDPPDAPAVDTGSPCERRPSRLLPAPHVQIPCHRMVGAQPGALSAMIFPLPCRSGKCITYPEMKTREPAGRCGLPCRAMAAPGLE